MSGRVDSRPLLCYHGQMANVILRDLDSPLRVRNTAQEIDALIDGGATGDFIIFQVEYVRGYMRNERINRQHIIRYFPTVEETGEGKH